MTGKRLPTLGHPTRKAAVIELYEQGTPQKEIAKRLCCSRNAVSQAIHSYRVETGRYIEPIRSVPAEEPTTRDFRGSQFDFCMKSYHKSVHGARAALEAIGA